MNPNEDSLPLTDDMLIPDGTETEQGISRMVLAGLPLAEGLHACAAEAQKADDRIALKYMANAIESGQPLAEVLSSSRRFPPYLRELLEVAVETGQVGKVLVEYLSVSRSQRHALRQTLLSCMYPFSVFIALVTLAAILPIYVTPGFKQIFNGFGVELPDLTRLIIAFSDLMLMVWPLFLLAMLGIGFSPLLHGVLPGIGLRQAVLYRIPMLGTSAKLASISEFCAMLALLVRAQVPLERCLDTLAVSVRSRSLRRGSHWLSVQLSRGSRIRDLLFESRDIPADLLMLLSQSQNHEVMADQLALTGKTYAVQAQLKLRQGLVLIEPLFLLLMAFGAGLFIMALFAPILKLLSDLS